MKNSFKKNLQLGAVLALSGVMAACGKLGFQGTDASGAKNPTSSKSEFPKSPAGDRKVTVNFDLVTMADDISLLLGCPANTCGDIKSSTLISGQGHVTDQSISPHQVSPESQIDVSYPSDLPGGAACLKVAQEAQLKGASLEIIAVADHVERLYLGIGVGYGGSAPGVVVGSEGGIGTSEPDKPEILPEVLPMLTLSPNAGPDCAVTSSEDGGTTSIVACPIPDEPKPPIGVEPSGYGLTLKKIESCKVGPVVVQPPKPGPMPEPIQPGEPPSGYYRH